MSLETGSQNSAVGTPSVLARYLSLKPLIQVCNIDSMMPQRVVAESGA